MTTTQTYPHSFFLDNTAWSSISTQILCMQNRIEKEVSSLHHCSDILIYGSSLICIEIQNRLHVITKRQKYILETISHLNNAPPHIQDNSSALLTEKEIFISMLF